MAILFVTGSDTGVGKTHVAGLLARRLSRDGFTQVIKPVESGAGAGRAADAPKAAGKWAEAHTLMTLAAPIAPLVAAKKAGKKLELVTLLKLYREVPYAPCRIIEGAGGKITGWDGEVVTLTHYTDVVAVGDKTLHSQAHTLLQGA